MIDLTDKELEFLDNLVRAKIRKERNAYLKTVAEGNEYIPPAGKRNTHLFKIEVGELIRGKLREALGGASE